AVAARAGPAVAREDHEPAVDDDRLVDLVGGDPDLRADLVAAAGELARGHRVEQQPGRVQLADAFAAPAGRGRVGELLRPVVRDPARQTGGGAGQVGGGREQVGRAPVQ